MSSHGEIVLILPISGFPGDALLALLHRFQLHAVPYSVAARLLGRCHGTGDVVISATRRIADLRPSEFAGLVLVDGEPERLRRDRVVVDQVRVANASGVFVAAVAEGMLALGRSGIIRGCAVAADDRLADRLRRFGAIPLREPLVIRELIATATEAGAPALGDAIHDLRGPAVIGPELSP